MTTFNPFYPGKVINLKDTYLDIKSVSFNGFVVVIEMPVARMPAFSNRVMYNLVKGYGNELEIGDNYLFG